jgi:hypothetical protein
MNFVHLSSKSVSHPAEMAEPEINAPQRSFRDAEATWQIRLVQDPPCPASRKQEPVQQPVPLNRDR